MRTGYERLADTRGVVTRLADLAPRTVVFDVEPLIARWDTDIDALTHGLATITETVTTQLPGLRALVFATNSRRFWATPLLSDGITISYQALAAKPFRTRHYRALPTPGVVIGDQIATDGVLAWRLGYVFMHFRPADTRLPFGPWLMKQVGRAVKPLLFT